MRTFNIREKSQNNGGGIPTEMLVAQQPKAIESRNWYQMIAMAIFYIHVIWYIRPKKKRNVSGNPTDPVKNSPTLIFFFLFSENENSKIKKKKIVFFKYRTGK